MTSSNGLRQRNATPSIEGKRIDPEDQFKNREEVVWGKTPGGKGIRTPVYALGPLTKGSSSFPCSDHSRCYHDPLESQLPEK